MEAPSGERAVSTRNVIPSTAPDRPIVVLYRATFVGLGRSQPHAASAALAMVKAIRTGTANLRDGEPPVALVATDTVKAGLWRASEKAFALSKRSAGSFSNAFATAAATCGGTALRNSLTGRTSSVTIFRMIACADEPVCGGSPVSISYNTDPRA